MREKKFFFVIYDIRFKGHLFLLIYVNLKEKFSIGKRCKDFFYFFIISLKREESQDFFIEGLV